MEMEIYIRGLKELWSTLQNVYEGKDLWDFTNLCLSYQKKQTLAAKKHLFLIQRGIFSSAGWFVRLICL